MGFKQFSLSRHYNIETQNNNKDTTAAQCQSTETVSRFLRIKVLANRQNMPKTEPKTGKNYEAAHKRTALLPPWLAAYFRSHSHRQLGKMAYSKGRGGGFGGISVKNYISRVER